MDTKINAALVKTLRSKKAWSQDQLAQVAGLSLRTIQRIENSGVASMDSRAAIAAVFEMNTEQLCEEVCEELVPPKNKHLVKGVVWGFTGTILGLVSAYTSITLSLINGHILAGEAGIYYGSIGAFCGASCALLAVLAEKLKRKDSVSI
ncbi:MAG: helix-turn-helix domain-containing protein [Agarilytica sp.]